MGAQPARIIGRHLLPGFMSHLIASATLSIPAMILGETALSFLGLGLRPPITSWGVLLNEAQNINVGGALSLAHAAGGAGDHRDPRLQLPRRRPARRGRPVPVAGARARASLVQPAPSRCGGFENRYRLDGGAVESMPINDLLRYATAIGWHG